MVILIPSSMASVSIVVGDEGPSWGLAIDRPGEEIGPGSGTSSGFVAIALALGGPSRDGRKLLGRPVAPGDVVGSAAVDEGPDINERAGEAGRGPGERREPGPGEIALAAIPFARRDICETTGPSLSSFLIGEPVTRFNLSSS